MTAGRPWLKQYAAGVPAEVEVPTGSLYDMLAASVSQFAGNVALEFFGSTTTYAELGRQVESAAEGLRLLGVRKGDPVAIVLPNCPQHVVAFYAVLRLGAIVVEHNPLYTPRELRHQFEDHGAKVAIAWDKTVGTIRDFPRDTAVEHIVAVDLTRQMPLRMRLMLRLPLKKARTSRAALTTPARGATSWEHVVGARPVAEGVERPGPADVAVIQYTSGTTADPKGAILTHANLAANVAQGRAWLPTITPGTAIVYAVLPMFHAYGLTLCLTFSMSIGARLVLFPRFDTDLVLDVAKKRLATFLPAVPPIYSRLLDAAAQRGVSLKGIGIALSGAMPLPAALIERWEAQTGGYLVEGYGLSETSPVLIGNPVGPTRRPGVIGVPFPSTEIRVVDPENPDVDRTPGEEGELLARGPQVFSGYWKKPDETAEAFVPARDGGKDWFRTGDIVTVDADGFVRVVDRLKELIITGGFKVAPSEVEEALRGHPDIEDVAVVGLKSEHSSEDVVAAVVLKPGHRLDEAGIRDFARTVLAAYKVPKRVIAVAELPKSLVGKVLRRQVRDMLILGGGEA